MDGTQPVECPNTDCGKFGIARQSQKDNENKGKYWIKCQYCNQFKWLKEDKDGNLVADEETNKRQKTFHTAPKMASATAEVMTLLCNIKTDVAGLAKALAVKEDRIAALEARLDKYDQNAAKSSFSK